MPQFLGFDTMANRLRATLVALGVCLCACTAAIRSEGGTSAPGSSDSSDDTPGDDGTQQERPSTPSGPEAPSCSEAPSASPGRVWLISDAQWAHTVATLFQGRSKDGNRDLRPLEGITAPLSLVDAGHRFSTRASAQRVTESALAIAIRAAEGGAARLYDSLAKTSCLAMETGFEACLRELVTSRGELLFRRPLSLDEVTKYTPLATDVVGSAGKRAAFELAFQALLTAPQFLYRSEIGTPSARAGLGTLTLYEAASALSFSLTDGPPDQALWEAAKRGALEDRAEVLRQVARLLGPLGPSQTVRRFLREHLRYEEALDANDKTVELHKPEDVVHDTDAFIADLLTTSGRKDFLRTLFTTHTGFASATTAFNYGVQASTKEPQKVTFAGDRVGFLGQASWLSAFSQPSATDPIRRGRYVRETLLCGTIPAVPIGTIPAIPEDPSRTVRERLVQHKEEPSCRACHELFDPIGLGLEGFDHVGRLRTTEAGRPVDTSGHLKDAGEVDGPFNGLAALADKLGAAERVRTCFAARAFEYWLGREPAEEERCEIDRVRREYDARGGDLVALIGALFTSDTFWSRTRAAN